MFEWGKQENAAKKGYQKRVTMSQMQHCNVDINLAHGASIFSYLVYLTAHVSGTDRGSSPMRIRFLGLESYCP